MLLLLQPEPALATDPYAFFDWDVSYVTAAPLGVKQQVIGINGKFPGPVVNVTTNWNVVVNVLNDLDEPLLITWNGIQHRKNCWQDGVLGTNCPIPSGWNWTYEFQVKDQIGSFFYFPSTGLQRAAAAGTAASSSTTATSSPCRSAAPTATSPSSSATGTTRTTRI
ncbi:hypothetical protein PR202_ga07532 [Eleusine coracana subsp. coracana]|uniref:Plastocyanin-like domain-containing protein n=1 Tax=Eleusine coracana subsp. coracana TaxID=191504 RepID=A0AAV5BXS5_ELECO|nr:hypothetical protein PR202_ga07532 [Eleusine coracana subsp. coracana]